MAGVSFISTHSCPSLFPRSSPRPSLPLPSSSSRFHVRLCCHYSEDEELSDGQLHQLKRRDFVGCFSSVVALEMIASSGGEEAHAADSLQHKQRSQFQCVKDNPYNAIKVRNYLDYGAELFVNGEIV